MAVKIVLRLRATRGRLKVSGIIALRIGRQRRVGQDLNVILVLVVVVILVNVLLLSLVLNKQRQLVALVII